MFSLEFSPKFQNNYVKEQLYFHAVGTVEEIDELLKDLIRSVLNLLIHNLLIFPPEVFDLVKNIQNCIIVIFHLMCLTTHPSSMESFQPASYSVG